MKVLTADATNDPIVSVARMDLELLGARELDGLRIGHRVPAGVRVQRIGTTLLVATDRGLLRYEMTRGWDMPTRSAGEDGSPWRLSGGFRPWRDVAGAELQTIDVWDEQHGRQVLSSFHLDAPAVEIHRPVEGPQQAAWDEFVRTCMTQLQAVASKAA